MARNIDVAFKFGCGRYIQQENAIENNLYNELKNLGTKVLFVAGSNGYKVAIDKIKKAIDNTDIKYEVRMFSSVPCFENAEEIAKQVTENKFEIVCSVGGGVIGDIVKLVAEITGASIMHIPTSSATCVAATPLSITYDKDTRAFKGGYICKREADAVIVDTTIMINQPARLFWAGIVDSKAKVIEIQHYFMGGKSVPMGLEMALLVSKEINKIYEQNMNKVANAINERKITKTFETALFYSIAVTGIISGLSKNSSQTALAHAFYYEVRTSFIKEAKDYLHGEIVGVGLIVQLAFNNLDYKEIQNLLKEMNLPVCLSDIGIEPDEQNINRLVERLYEIGNVDTTDENALDKLKNAIMLIAK